MYHETKLCSLKNKQTNKQKKPPQKTKTTFRLNVESAIYCQREIQFIFYIIEKKKIYLFKTVLLSILSLETLPLIAKPHLCSPTWISCAYKRICFPRCWLD